MTLQEYLEGLMKRGITPATSVLPQTEARSIAVYTAWCRRTGNNPEAALCAILSFALRDLGTIDETMH